MPEKMTSNTPTEPLLSAERHLTIRWCLQLLSKQQTMYSLIRRCQILADAASVLGLLCSGLSEQTLWVNTVKSAYSKVLLICHNSNYHICSNPLMTEWTPHTIYWKIIISSMSGYVIYVFLEKKMADLQTVETLIRRHVLRHLIWVCTVCLLPF